MAQFRGYKTTCVLDFETAFNTPKTAGQAGFTLPIISNGVRMSQTLNQSAVLTGSRNPSQPFKGNRSVSGDVSVPVDVRSFGLWMCTIFGAPTTTGSGPYTHEFTIGDSQPSFLLEKEFAAAVRGLLTGLRTSSCSLQVGGDQELTASINVEGADEAFSDTAYDDTPTLLQVTPFQNFQASIKEGGSTLAIVTKASVELNTGLDTDQYCIGGGGVRNDIPEGLLEVSGSLTSLFGDTAMLDKALAGTETSLEISFVNGPHSLTFAIPELILEPQSPSIDGPQGVILETPWRGYWGDDAGGSAIAVTLVNDVASYVV